MDIPKEPLVSLSGSRVVTDPMGQRWHLHGDKIARPDYGGQCLYCVPVEFRMCGRDDGS
jgi:hypothetical protein